MCLFIDKIQKMKRIDLLHKIKELGLNKDNLLESLFKEVLNVHNLHEENFDISELNDLKNKLSVFKAKVGSKFHKHNRNYERLILNESVWLQVKKQNNFCCFIYLHKYFF